MLSRDRLADCRDSPAIKMALLRKDTLLYDTREQQLCLRVRTILAALGSNILLLLLVWCLSNGHSLAGLLLLSVLYLDSFVCGSENPFDLRRVGPRRKFLSVLAVM